MGQRTLHCWGISSVRHSKPWGSGPCTAGASAASGTASQRVNSGSPGGQLPLLNDNHWPGHHAGHVPALVIVDDGMAEAPNGGKGGWW
eukprot:310820-Pelagomonas_calceolata.AAC.2